MACRASWPLLAAGRLREDGVEVVDGALGRGEVELLLRAEQAEQVRLRDPAARAMSSVEAPWRPLTRELVGGGIEHGLPPLLCRLSLCMSRSSK